MATLEDIFKQADAEMAAPVVAKGSAHPLDNIFQEADAEIGSQLSSSDVLGIRNASIRGLSNAIGFAGEFAPTIERGSVFAPRLFGLSQYLGLEQPQVSPAKSGDVLKKIAKDRGAFDATKPRSEIGQFTSDIIEQGLSAAPFGPLAAVSSGVTSGPGAYGGRKVGAYFGNEELGETLGSIVSPFAIAGARAATQKAARTLGPTIASLPGVPEKIKDATMGASIGRTIRESVEDPDAVLASLKQSKPTEFQTAAEVAQSQGLSSLEDAVRAKGGELLNSLPEARSTARLDRATGNAAEISNYDRSKELERVLGRSVDQVEELEKAKWKLLPKDEKLIGDHLNADLSKQIAEITLDGAIPLSGTSAGLIKRWSDLSKEVISVDQLQAFRSKVLEESRAAKKLMQRNPTEDARNTVRITDTLLKHIDDVVDTNISAGLTTSETASVWSAARQATRNKYEAFLPQSGPKSQAAKAAFYGDEMKDAAAIQEGLRSPDVMMAQIKAAEAGGQDVRSIYQEALKAELASRPQSKWADFIEDRRLQFDLAFESNPQALSQINLALQDIASESRKYTRAKSAFGTNSSTFTRQAINERIDRNKGIAALGGAAVPAISGTYGAVEGWSSGDTIADKAARALLFGAGGAVAGKAYRGLASRASDSFDEGLALALRDPAIAARRLEQSKPTKFSEILGQVIREARPQATARGAGLVSNSIFGSGEKFQSLPQQIQQEENSSQNLSQGDLQRFLASPETVPNDSIQREEGETSADPTSLFNLSKSDLDMTPRDIDPLLKQAVIWQESRGNPNAVSKKGATGIMQIMPGTAREIAQELGIEEYDLRDPATNEMFGEYYLGKMLDQFDGDVELALTAYNQGPNRVKRLLERNNGSTLADIIDDLGPDGRSYAKLILGRYAKLKNESEQV